MADIALMELDRFAAEELASSPEEFAGRCRIILGPSWPSVADVATQTAQFLASRVSHAPWGAYLALEGAERRLVGTCSFKRDPDDTGAVEIAYFTFPGEEGRGVATAMAAALVDVASKASPPPAIVRAHTLPAMNASGRILQKLGFRRLGEVIDPEDGPVWRWEREPGPDVVTAP